MTHARGIATASLTLGLLLTLVVTLRLRAAERDPKADAALVAKVAARLIARAEPVEGYLWPPIVEVQDDVEVNAHATFITVKKDGEDRRQPGIYVKQGLLDKIVQGNEDRLALLLGHELAHILLKHIEGRQSATPLVANAITRDQETAADILGFQLALKAGYPRASLIEFAKLMRKNNEYNSFEGLNTDHPSWSERIAAFDSEGAATWRAMVAFETGVQFLVYEQYGLAARCFKQVTNEMPGCYEGWANLGYANLMLYCDKMDTSDLKAFDIGHLVTGGFYRQAESLDDPDKHRGIDEELWYDAIGAPREAIRLKPELVLPKATMAIAYLVSPKGKDVGAAARLFDEVIEALNKGNLEALDPLAQASLLTNAGVIELTAGRPDAGQKFFEQARKALEKVGRTDTLASSGQVGAALLYNDALRLTSAKTEPDRRSAVKEWESFLSGSSRRGMWWPLAYEQYKKLCEQLGVTAHTEDEFSQKREQLRLVVELALKDGKSVGLTEKIAEVQKRWGAGVKIPVIKRTNVARVVYEDRGIELIVSDQVLAITVRGPSAPPVIVQAAGPGGEKREIHVGMTQKELEAVLGKPRDVAMRELTVQRSFYRFYRALGLAVLVDQNGLVSEIVIGQLPSEQAPR